MEREAVNQNHRVQKHPCGLDECMGVSVVSEKNNQLRQK